VASRQRSGRAWRDGSVLFYCGDYSSSSPTVNTSALALRSGTARGTTPVPARHVNDLRASSACRTRARGELTSPGNRPHRGTAPYRSPFCAPRGAPSVQSGPFIWVLCGLCVLCGEIWVITRPVPFAALFVCGILASRHAVSPSGGDSTSTMGVRQHGDRHTQQQVALACHCETRGIMTQCSTVNSAN
jgi:hypothetical protein